MNIGEIIGRISEAKKRIKKYEGIIEILNNAQDYIKERQNRIEEDFYNPLTGFDMTRGQEWRGKCEKDAEKAQENICKATKEGLMQTSQLLANIQAAIEKLYSLIKESEDEIEGLEALMDSLMQAPATIL